MKREGKKNDGSDANVLEEKLVKGESDTFDGISEVQVAPGGLRLALEVLSGALLRLGSLLGGLTEAHIGLHVGDDGLLHGELVDQGCALGKQLLDHVALLEVVIGEERVLLQELVVEGFVNQRRRRLMEDDHGGCLLADVVREQHLLFLRLNHFIKLLIISCVVKLA